MIRETYIFNYDYEVTYQYELGHTGTYDIAPEPNEVDIIDIYDNYEGRYLDYRELDELIPAVEDEIHDYLNNL